MPARMKSCACFNMIIFQFVAGADDLFPNLRVNFYLQFKIFITTTMIIIIKRLFILSQFESTYMSYVLRSKRDSVPEHDKNEQDECRYLVGKNL